MNRQNYYKERTLRQRREGDNSLIERLVRDERAAQPRLGRKKPFHLLKPTLASSGEKIGRDRFFAVLREKSLLLERLPQDNEQPGIACWCFTIWSRT
jgi:hypothetical protein